VIEKACQAARSGPTESSTLYGQAGDEKASVWTKDAVRYAAQSEQRYGREKDDGWPTTCTNHHDSTAVSSKGNRTDLG
jgi:hypothetical protein